MRADMIFMILTQIIVVYLSTRKFKRIFLLDKKKKNIGRIFGNMLIFTYFCVMNVHGMKQGA